jgi:acyl transferase domain-containing protein
MTAEQAQDPDYWVAHLRGTVRFHAGLRQLGGLGGVVAVEVGPEQTLTRMIARGRAELEFEAVAACRSRRENDGDVVRFASALAALWQRGVELNADYCFGVGAKVALPTYAFARSRYWIDAAGTQSGADSGASRDDISAPIAPPVAAQLDDVDAVIKAVWGRLLGLDSIPEDADFFALGGDSLALTQCQKLLADRHGVQVELDVLYQNSDLPALAAAIRLRLDDAPVTAGAAAHSTVLDSIEADIEAMWQAISAMLGEPVASGPAAEVAEERA